ncbi:MAG: caspase family protein [Bacteroidota bacterium]
MVNKREKKPDIFVLSIGINEYENKRIANLTGCVKDTLNLKQVLQAKFNIPNSQYKILINEQATRRKIIRSFRNHFSQLKNGDIALFHFSGHGSWEKTSPAFVEAGLESLGGRNEVIVCHDSNVPYIYNIADKEIRWLVAELQNTFEGSPKEIHFVCLFDCCHAGSSTRGINAPLIVRMTPSLKKVRPLNSYLEGQYSQLKKHSGKLFIPPVNLVSLAACSPRESALEDQNGGVFMRSLIQVLSSDFLNTELPTYANLFSLMRAFTRQKSDNTQTPYFEYFGTFNPNNTFLLLEKSKAPLLPNVIFENGYWRVVMGAIHGLQKDIIRDLKIPIYDPSDMENPLFYAYCDRIELEFTKLKEIKNSLFKPKDFQGTNFEEFRVLDPKKTYLAGLSCSTLPIRLNIESEDVKIKELLTLELNSDLYRNQFIFTDSAKYTLHITAREIQILCNRPDSLHLIYGIKKIDQSAIRHILDQLKQINRWEQLMATPNPKKSLINPEDIEVCFTYQDYNKQLNRVVFSTEDKINVGLHYKKKKGPIPFVVEVKNNTSRKLYFYLIHLDHKFGIYQKHENYPKGYYPNDMNTEIYNSFTALTGLGISDDEVMETNDIFLLVASKENLQAPHAFEQLGFGKHFGKMVDSIEQGNQTFGNSSKKTRSEFSATNQFKVNWIIKKIDVKLIRVTDNA